VRLVRRCSKITAPHAPHALERATSRGAPSLRDPAARRAQGRGSPKWTLIYARAVPDRGLYPHDFVSVSDHLARGFFRFEGEEPILSTTKGQSHLGITSKKPAIPVGAHRRDLLG
jgi:hypothetical protein